MSTERRTPSLAEDDLLRNAARAEWEGNPPEPVADWLAEHGIAA